MERKKGHTHDEIALPHEDFLEGAGIFSVPARVFEAELRQVARREQAAQLLIAAPGAAERRAGAEDLLGDVEPIRDVEELRRVGEGARGGLAAAVKEGSVGVEVIADLAEARRE